MPTLEEYLEKRYSKNVSTVENHRFSISNMIFIKTRENVKKCVEEYKKIPTFTDNFKIKKCSKFGGEHL